MYLMDGNRTESQISLYHFVRRESNWNTSCFLEGVSRGQSHSTVDWAMATDPSSVPSISYGTPNPTKRDP